jgi:hypothetical protein
VQGLGMAVQGYLVADGDRTGEIEIEERGAACRLGLGFGGVLGAWGVGGSRVMLAGGCAVRESE